MVRLAGTDLRSESGVVTKSPPGRGEISQLLVSSGRTSQRQCRRRSAVTRRASPLSTSSETARIEVRLSIAARWIQRKASGSLSPCWVISTPLARSISLRASSRSRRPVDLGLQRAHLGEARRRHLDGRQQVALLERLDEVGHRAGVAGPLDEVALAERGEHDDRGDARAGDLGRRGDAVELGHLDVADDQIGHQLLGPARPPARRRRPRRRPRSPLPRASRAGRAGSAPRPRR